MNNKRNKIVAFLMILMLVFSLTVAAYAYSEWSEVFRGAVDASTRWACPIADSSGAEFWATITSKWNEPRTVGTSPHVGVDLSIKHASTVIAVADGYLTKTSDKYNTASLKTANNVYCHYEHMNSITADEGKHKKKDVLGVAGDYGCRGQLHLHFGAYDANQISGRKSYRNETLYRHASEWKYGRNVDTFSQAQWNNYKIAKITAVFSGAGNTHSEIPEEVRIYHRKAETKSWTDGGLMKRNGYNYTYSFEGKYPSGTTIQWMVRIKRDINIKNKYVWAPAKFYNPSLNPNSTSYAYDYFENKIFY